MIAVLMTAEHTKAREIDFCFRQIHLDFHTSEWVEHIGSDFDPDVFAETLEKARVDSVTCFGRCCHGWMYYDSKKFPDKKHPHLKRNLLKEQIDACHKRGIRVPIYISVQPDVVMSKEHPEWRIVDVKGEYIHGKPNTASFWQMMCVNTPYRDYLKEQTQEMLDTLDVDGFFFDIVSILECCCPHCRQGMKERNLDVNKQADRRAYATWLMNDFKEDMTRFIRESHKDCTIFYNSGHVGPTIRDSFAQYTHLELESLPSGGWGYLHFPLTGRFARTLGKDYLGMTGKFHTTWGDFHSFKNQAALEFECFMMLALNAKCSIGDQLHPHGALEPYSYQLIGNVYSQIEKKEPWCRNAVALTDIGVFTTEEYLGGRTPQADMGAVRILLEGGHQFDIIDSQSDLGAYQVLVLPDQIPINPAFKQRLQTYLSTGGKILASYESGLLPDQSAFAMDAFGIRKLEDTKDPGGKAVRGKTYWSNDYSEYIVPTGRIGKKLHPTEYVMYIKGMNIQPTGDTSVLASVTQPFFNRTPEHYFSHKQAPSSGKRGNAAITQKGNLIYFAHPVFRQYDENAAIWCKQLVLNALDILLKEPRVQLQAPSSTVVTLNAQSPENRWVLHVLHYIPERRGKSFDTIEDIVPIYDIPVSIKVPTTAKRVLLVPENKELHFVHLGERISFSIPTVTGHQMVCIEF
jgi:hypothetical protein